VIALCTTGDATIPALADAALPLPTASEHLLPCLAAIPLQLFAYHMALRRGCDVDRPRNLAKSVTVE
jgi:glucosamine--fructose-6-phosphate aminotransferase (isomerizing)